jgi:predicted RNA binding protein YcfA (HicA-like mRNA interferase family)
MTFKRQKGTHMILVGTDPPCRVVVPAHKNVRVGTLRAIISQAELTVEAFLAARDRE